MAGTVGDMGNQIRVGRVVRPAGVEDRADGAHYVNVAGLVLATDGVG